MSKRIMAMAFAVLMVISLIPAKPVSAASMYYPKKVTTFESRGTSNSINISNLPKGVRLKSVKTSNWDVINITNIGINNGVSAIISNDFLSLITDLNSFFMVIFILFITITR